MPVELRRSEIRRYELTRRICHSYGVGVLMLVRIYKLATPDGVDIQMRNDSSKY